jgi:hypothetical protein
MKGYNRGTKVQSVQAIRRDRNPLVKNSMLARQNHRHREVSIEWCLELQNEHDIHSFMETSRLPGEDRDAKEPLPIKRIIAEMSKNN